MNIKEYAEHRGVSHVAVIKALKAGRITKEPDGSIDPDKADADWDRNTDTSRNPSGVRKAGTAQAPEAPLQTGPDYNVSRAVREAYTARLAKLEYEERIGTLVRADTVKVKWFNTLRIVRDRMLQLPDRIAATLMAESDPLKFKATLDAEIRRILEDASNEVEKQE